MSRTEVVAAVLPGRPNVFFKYPAEDVVAFAQNFPNRSFQNVRADGK